MTRRVLLCVGLVSGLLLGTASANAQSCTSNQIGSFTYTNCSDGTSSTTSQVGNFGYTTYSDGTTATRNQIGNFGYTTYSDGTTATTSQVGNATHTNFTDGTSASTVRVGDYLYTTFRDGSTVTTWVGGSSPRTTTIAGNSTTVAPATTYVAPAASAVVNADPGIRFSSADPYGNTYLPQGTLVKSDKSAAIYIVWSGQLRAFQTWGSYLRAGGRSDLSNVVRYGDLGAYLTSLIGLPVPI